MPTLPGGQQLTLSAPKAKPKAGAKKRGKGKSAGAGDDKTPPRKRVRGDEQLLQLDLKRKQRVLVNNVVPSLQC